MTPPVLAGVDGSPASTAAAHWAAEEALRRGVPLRLVHAWPWLTDGRAGFATAEAPPAAAQQVVQGAAEAIRRRHRGLAVHADVVLDGAVDGLVAESADAGLLVLGSRGLGGFAGLLLGSVSTATVARSASPVVVVRPPAANGGPPEVPEVVVGVDTRAVDEALLAFAFDAAELRGARVRAVHGWELPAAFATVGVVPSQPELAELEALEAKELSLALAEWRERRPGTELVEQVGLGAARTLVAVSGAADLVVVGRRHRPYDLGRRLGPVTSAVLPYADAPVAVVPHP
ncbi:universal stress protein [Kitasatospora sp. NPDC086009]|uniref:universal stress protein n=1 Tax=unclassified Kitasatospora TaxID=2633591 RepID=UPI0037CB0F13